MKTYLLRYLAYRWKKMFNKMDPQNEAVLMRLKEQYFGKYYQWLRPINNEVVGDVVRVVDVKQRGNMFLLIFNAGSPINVDLIEQYLAPHNSDDGMSNSQIKMLPGEEIAKRDNLSNISFSNNQAPAPSLQQQPQQQKSDMFAMFKSEEKSVALPLIIKMPAIRLIKMMYNNATDKDAFLAEFAQYVINNISVDVVKTSISKLLEESGRPKKPNKDAGD